MLAFNVLSLRGRGPKCLTEVRSLRMMSVCSNQSETSLNTLTFIETPSTAVSKRTSFDQNSSLNRGCGTSLWEFTQVPKVKGEPIQTSRFNTGINECENKRSSKITTLLTGTAESDIIERWGSSRSELIEGSSSNIVEGWAHDYDVFFSPPALTCTVSRIHCMEIF